ncbi:MAG: hypothetical protein ACT4NY_07140 [Pseudonocardiales bacterium]
MARVPAVLTREAGLLGRLAYRMARRRYGAVPEPVAVMLHHRPVFWAYGLWEMTSGSHGVPQILARLSLAGLTMS